MGPQRGESAEQIDSDDGDMSALLTVDWNIFNG